MFTACYYVPTHRCIEYNSLISFADEIIFARNKFQCDIPLVILDDKNDIQNQKNIREITRRYPHIRIFYFQNTILRKLYDLISSSLPEDDKSVFLKLYPDGIVNYGNTFNKIFITALFFNNKIIHRRDADVYPQKKIKSDGSSSDPVLPIELELTYINKEYQGKKIYIVGGGYKGKWGLDIDFLPKDDDSQLFKLFKCLSISDAIHEEVKNIEIIGCNRPYKEDKLECDEDTEPDCGNIAFYEIFKYLPCSPQPYVLGSDYFPLLAAKEAGFSVIYHNRALEHSYTKCRYDNYEKLYSYWKGVVALTDYQFFYRKYLHKFLNTYYKSNNITLDRYQMNPESLLVDLPDSLMTFHTTIDHDINKREDIFTSIIEVLFDNGNQLQKEIAETLRKQKNTFFSQTEKGIKSHIDILRIWPKILTIIAESREDLSVKTILDEACIKNQ